MLPDPMEDNSMEKVIVLGAGYGALAVVKALAKEGINITLFFTNSDDHARFSRFVTERVRSPDPIDNSAKLLDILMDPKQNGDKQLLIPTLDEYVIFISQNRKELKKRYVFTVQDWEITSGIINKNLLYSHAVELGIPTPKYFIPDSVQFLEDRRNRFCYPCILKPSDTHLFDRIYGRKNFLVYDYLELVDRFIDIQHHDLNVMISEIIPGEDSSIFSYRSYIDSQGDVLAEMCTQKLRQYPPGFGQGSVVRTVPMIAEVRGQALRLLRCFSYRGESSTEFKLDYRDNQYKLMEINVRPVVTEWLFVKAGINFPYLIYADLIENTRKSPQHYRHELYWIHNYWESVNFIRYLMTGNLKRREFLGPYWKKKVFAVPFSDDPIHFLIETYFNIKRAFKKVKKRSLL
jgi:D-aspartate ligase